MSTIIDVNVYPTIEDVTINTTEFLTTINVNTVVGGNVDSVVAGTNITVDNTDPDNPIINATVPAFVPSNYDLEDFTNVGADPYAHVSGTVQSVTGATVDNTDPLNPIVLTPNLKEVLSIEGRNINVQTGATYNLEISNKYEYISYQAGATSAQIQLVDDTFAIGDEIIIYNKDTDFLEIASSISIPPSIYYNGTNYDTQNTIIIPMYSLARMVCVDTNYFELTIQEVSSIPTLQQVLDNNHNLVDGNNFQGSASGFGNTGINVNSFGTGATVYASGSNTNALGSGAAASNSEEHVNAFGQYAGEINSYKNVNLFGYSATADAENQNVFSKWISGVTKYLGRLSFNNITADRKWELPDASGTIALTSDIPTLQQVTDEGNVTTNPIIFNDGSDEFNISGTAIKYKTIGTGFTKELVFDSLTANRNIILPDASGTVALTSDIPAPITIDATPTDGSTNAVSSNGVFDALSTKQTIWKSGIDGATVANTLTITPSYSQLIPAGTFVAGDTPRLEFRATSGVSKSSASSIYFYVNTANNLSGATQIGIYTSGATNRTVQAERTFSVKGATTKTIAVATSVPSDLGITANMATLTIDWTINQYILFAIGHTVADQTLTGDFYKITK